MEWFVLGSQKPLETAEVTLAVFWQQGSLAPKLAEPPGTVVGRLLEH